VTGWITQPQSEAMDYSNQPDYFAALDSASSIVSKIGKTRSSIVKRMAVRI
jgi:hypothetical protein